MSITKGVVGYPARVNRQSLHLTSMGVVSALLLACSSVTGVARNTSPCPSGAGEFPPTDCAIIDGRAVDGQGRAVSRLGLRVDSIGASGYAYASDAVVTDSEGRFVLTVLRINRFQPPTTPDTATVDVKAYTNTSPNPGDSPVSRAPVRMRFAPLGRPVERTQATLTFNLGR